MILWLHATQVSFMFVSSLCDFYQFWLKLHHMLTKIVCPSIYVPALKQSFDATSLLATAPTYEPKRIV